MRSQVYLIFYIAVDFGLPELVISLYVYHTESRLRYRTGGGVFNLKRLTAKTKVTERTPR